MRSCNDPLRSDPRFTESAPPHEFAAIARSSQKSRVSDESGARTTDFSLDAVKEMNFVGGGLLEEARESVPQPWRRISPSLLGARRRWMARIVSVLTRSLNRLNAILRLIRLNLAVGFLVKSSAGNRADDEFDNAAEGCHHRKSVRKKATKPLDAEVGKQRTYNPDGQAAAGITPSFTPSSGQLQREASHATIAEATEVYEGLIVHIIDGVLDPAHLSSEKIGKIDRTRGRRAVSKLDESCPVTALQAHEVVAGQRFVRRSRQSGQGRSWNLASRRCRSSLLAARLTQAGSRMPSNLLV